MNDQSETIRQIWREHLNAPAVEDHDNFFILGGDSILGTLVLLAVSERYDIDLGMQDLLRNPVFRDFGQVVTRRRECSRHC